MSENLTLKPAEKSASSIRWRVAERINWMAFRTLFAVERLTRALRCSQTTRIQIIFTTSGVEKLMSRYL
jgi:hypothetical protein